MADKNPQVIKLQKQINQLTRQNEQLKKEIKMTPDSLKARIKGLNELTNDLNAYLKEYILNQGLENLKEEFEKQKGQLKETI